MMMSPFLKRYANYSDDKLIDIAVHSAADYTGEAVSAARQLLVERGRDVDTIVRELDQSAADLRAARDRARHVIESGRAARIAEIAEAGRAVGHCLLCERPAQDERVINLRRDAGFDLRRTAEVRHFTVLPVPIPLCRVCKRKHRPLRLLKRLGPMATIFAFIGSIFLPLALLWSGFEPEGWGIASIIAFLFGPFALVALIVIGEDLSVKRIGRRLALAHPRGPNLLRAGFQPVARSDTGSASFELYLRFLRHGSADERELAEARLIGLGDSEVVAAMRQLLGHRRARPHALRVLAALRAKDSIEDILPLTRAFSRTVREDARRALVDLGVSDGSNRE